MGRVDSEPEAGDFRASAKRKFIPILGFLFSFCLSVIGWGVTIRARFGTKGNWLKIKA